LSREREKEQNTLPIISCGDVMTDRRVKITNLGSLLTKHMRQLSMSGAYSTTTRTQHLLGFRLIVNPLPMSSSCEDKRHVIERVSNGVNGDTSASEDSQHTHAIQHH
jgi:hypothetical protein